MGRPNTNYNSIDTFNVFWRNENEDRRIRISTEDQNTVRQEVLMQELGVDEIYIDKARSKNIDRLQLKKMISYVRQGDTVIVESTIRLARNMLDFLDIKK